MRINAHDDLGIRLAKGASAFLLYDLITGLAAYSVITLTGLWLFCVTWIRIAGEYASIGRSFGSASQLELAWIGVFLTLPLAVAVIYLAIQAYRVPRDVARTGGHETVEQIRLYFSKRGGIGPRSGPL